MCLILFAHRVDPRYRLVLAANRDEFFDRPTAPADYWADAPEILAGRDLQKGGTWLGVTRSGRWAALTNFRDGRATPAADARSRGELVAGFLRGRLSAAEYAATALPRPDQYPGFNLLVGDAHSVHVICHTEPARTIEPGVRGLSNHKLDTPWPKVSNGRRRLEAALRGGGDLEDALFGALADRTPADAASLPSTGIPADWERWLSPAFIRAPGYGTRSSTVLLVGHEGSVSFRERSFDEAGRVVEDRMFRFSVLDPALVNP